MRSFLFSIFFIILIASATAVSAKEVVVELKGLSKEMEQNALFLLSLKQFEERENTSAAEIRRLFDKGKKQIQESLKPYGYYKAKVTSSLEKHDGVWHAVYNVDPGPPIIVTKMDFTLVGEGKEDPIMTGIRDNILQRIGAVLNQDRYEAGKKAFKKVAYSNGYIDARFTTSQIRLDRVKNTAEMVAVLDTGKRYAFGEVIFDQTVLRTKSIQKYVEITPGEPYVEKKMAELQRALYKSGYFKYVRVQGMVEEAKDYKIPIVVTAMPVDFRNKYDLGAGFATDTGLHAKLGWKNRLINDHGHSVRSSIKVAQRESTVSVAYAIPVFNPRYDSHTIAASYNDESWDDTDTTLLTFGASLNHEGETMKYGTAVELRSDKYSVGVTDGDAFLVMPSVNWSLLLADSLVNTGIGIKLTVNVRGATEELVSDVSFLQADVGARAIISPFKKWRLIGRIIAGATWVDDIEDLPPSLRFYAGGDNSIRGFGYKKIGPTDDSGTLVGGKYLFVQSIEIERELTDLWSLAGFYDVGDAMDVWDDSEKNEGVGGGIRLRLPFGQIRLDIACAISEDDKPFRLHLAVRGDL